MEMGATEGFMKYQIEQLEEENKKLKEENKELKAKINRVIDLFKRGDSSDLYDYIDDLSYEKED